MRTAVVWFVLLGAPLTGCGDRPAPWDAAGDDIAAPRDVTDDLADATADVARDGAPDAAADVAPEDASTGPTTQRFACMDCPTDPFPEPDATPCIDDAGAGPKPVLFYPPDGVLLPPNLGTLEVQFSPGIGNTLWEVDFTNAATDVRVVTRCDRIASVRGVNTGNCGMTLSPEVWNAIVAANRGGDPLTITVRGRQLGVNCTATASVTHAIQFAEEDITGGIYYWQSAVFGGEAGRTGGIYVHDFGGGGTTPTAFLESGPTGLCTGCHNLSRDGQRMSVGLDDPDADDEFADINTEILRVGDRSNVTMGVGAGFQTFTHDHRYMLATTWGSAAAPGTSRDRAFALYDGDTGMQLSTVMLPDPMVGTQPDWSADDHHVVFVAPGSFVDEGYGPVTGDHHFHGGDLYVMDVTSGPVFGAPVALLPGNLRRSDPHPNAANYYPSYSPDGGFIVFNHVDAGDVFYNRDAQVWLATSNGAAAVPLDRLNGGEHLTNSWPRWSPFVQHYRGHQILWVTFSSNRDYGVRVDNGTLPNCYPIVSPREDAPQSTDWTMCAEPQIWMAAVRLDSNAVAMGSDPSWPAFWLPFQSLVSHNHSAQWVERVLNPGCLDLNARCPDLAGAGCCDGLTCSPTSHTCVASSP